MTIHNLDQAIRANQAAGRRFFSKSTMRYFHSRVSEKFYPVPGGAFFVTSETDMAGGVRHITDDGHTSTRGGYLDGFRRFIRRENAHRYAWQLQRKANALSNKED